MKSTSKNIIQKERLKTAIENGGSSVGKLIQKKPKRHIESDTQKAFIKWFDFQYPKLSILLFASSNGRHGGGKTIKIKGKDIPISAINSKQEGQRKGVADLFLSIPKITRSEKDRRHGLYIETKTQDGKQSKEQIEFQKAVENQGYQYTICRSVEEFIKTINKYL
jgi:hypothetical protein